MMTTTDNGLASLWRRSSAKIRASLCTPLPILALCAPTANAQSADPHPPGVQCADLGQSTRFDNEFNPAISLSLDLVGEYLDASSSADGIDISLRGADLLSADWIDPSSFAWATIAYEGGELLLDEAAPE